MANKPPHPIFGHVDWSAVAPRALAPLKPEKSPPGVIAEIWGRIKKFILPEETMSLKVVFDNLRNYVICAGVIAALGASEGLSIGKARSLSFGLGLFVLFFLGANVIQSLLIIFKVTDGIGRFPKEIRPKWSWWKRRGARVILVLVFAPLVVAAYDGFSALVVWALSGGGRPPGS